MQSCGGIHNGGAQGSKPAGAHAKACAGDGFGVCGFQGRELEKIVETSGTIRPNYQSDKQDKKENRSEQMRTPTAG